MPGRLRCRFRLTVTLRAATMRLAKAKSGSAPCSWAMAVQWSRYPSAAVAGLRSCRINLPVTAFFPTCLAQVCKVVGELVSGEHLPGTDGVPFSQARDGSAKLKAMRDEIRASHSPR